MTWAVSVTAVFAVASLSAAIAVLVGRSITRADQIEIAHRRACSYTQMEVGDVSFALFTSPVDGPEDGQVGTPPSCRNAMCAACGRGKAVDLLDRGTPVEEGWTHDVDEDYCPDCAAVRAQTWGY